MTSKYKRGDRVLANIQGNRGLKVDVAATVDGIDHGRKDLNYYLKEGDGRPFYCSEADMRPIPPGWDVVRHLRSALEALELSPPPRYSEAVRGAINRAIGYLT